MIYIKFLKKAILTSILLSLMIKAFLLTVAAEVIFFSEFALKTKLNKMFTCMFFLSRLIELK